MPAGGAARRACAARSISAGGPGARLRRRSAAHRRTLRPSPRWPSPVSHRRPRPLPGRRQHRVPRPRGRPGEDSRPPHRTGRAGRRAVRPSAGQPGGHRGARRDPRAQPGQLRHPACAGGGWRGSAYGARRGAPAGGPGLAPRLGQRGEGIAAAVAALDRACLASLAAWLAGSGLFASATPLDFATLCQRLGIAEARQRRCATGCASWRRAATCAPRARARAGWAAPSVPRRVRRTPGRRSPAARRRRSGRPSWSPTCVTARNPSASNWPGGSARRR